MPDPAASPSPGEPRVVSAGESVQLSGSSHRLVLRRTSSQQRYLRLTDPDGRPLAHMDCRLKGADKPTATDANGLLELSDCPAGPLELEVWEQMYPLDPSGGTQANDPLEVVIPDQVGTLAAQVVQHSGEPLANTPYQISGARELTGTTDAEGALRHEGVPLDFYQLTPQGCHTCCVPAGEGELYVVVARPA